MVLLSLEVHYSKIKETVAEKVVMVEVLTAFILMLHRTASCF